MTEFGKETIQLVSSLEYEGEPCFYQVGSMEVAATRERWEDLKRKAGWAKSWGEDACLLNPAEARAKLPFLDASKILGAYYVPSDGVTKAVQACAAMANLAEPHAEFYERTPVTGIEVERGRVRGVITSSGRIATDRVLICAGIWGPKVGKLAGISIPLIPVEHQLAWTTPLPELAGETRWAFLPVLRHQDRDMYFRQRCDHFAIGSYQHDPVLVEAEAIRPHGQPDDMPASNPFDPVAFEPAWQEALSLMPALRQTRIAEAYNGMFSFTPDGFPLIGEAADVRGCWVAEAIWIMHAGGAARAVAELLTSGKAWVDLREA
ncbi:MAG: sarcosine dehydrogenase, partial [Chloroflexota bacterium]